jgi:hypothetical protein
MNVFEISQAPISDVAHAIQLSLAPVFLLSGIGVLLGMLTSRLARIVDRARVMEQRLQFAAEQEMSELLAWLLVITRRARLMNRAITLSTIAALLVASVVALLFVSAFSSFSLAPLIGLLFILSMMSLIASLLCFLLEIRIATASLRIGPHKPD